MCDLMAQKYLKTINRTNNLDDSTFFIDKREIMRNKLFCIKAFLYEDSSWEMNNPNFAKNRRQAACRRKK